MDTNDNTSLTSRAQNKGVADLSSASGARPKKSCYAPIKHNRLRRKNGRRRLLLVSLNGLNNGRFHFVPGCIDEHLWHILHLGILEIGHA